MQVLLKDPLTALVQEFDGFMEKHPEVLDTVKVPVEDIRAKARILVLLSIASQENELSFAAIKVRTYVHGSWQTPKVHELGRQRCPLSGSVAHVER